MKNTGEYRGLCAYLGENNLRSNLLLTQHQQNVYNNYYRENKEIVPDKNYATFMLSLLLTNFRLH